MAVIYGQGAADFRRLLVLTSLAIVEAVCDQRGAFRIVVHESWDEARFKLRGQAPTLLHRLSLEEGAALGIDLEEQTAWR